MNAEEEAQGEKSPICRKIHRNSYPHKKRSIGSTPSCFAGARCCKKPNVAAEIDAMGSKFPMATNRLRRSQTAGGPSQIEKMARWPTSTYPLRLLLLRKDIEIMNCVSTMQLSTAR